MGGRLAGRPTGGEKAYARSLSLSLSLSLCSFRSLARSPHNETGGCANFCERQQHTRARNVVGRRAHTALLLLLRARAPLLYCRRAPASEASALKAILPQSRPSLRTDELASCAPPALARSLASLGAAGRPASERTNKWAPSGRAARKREREKAALQLQSFGRRERATNFSTFSLPLFSRRSLPRQLLTQFQLIQTHFFSLVSFQFTTTRWRREPRLANLSVIHHARRPASQPAGRPAGRPKRPRRRNFLGRQAV